MFVYSTLQVNGAPHVGALILPLEVDFLILILILRVSVGHRSPVDDIFCILMIRLGSRSYPLSISRVLRLFGHVSNLYIF